MSGAKRAKCREPGCTNIAQRVEMCGKHYRAALARGERAMASDLGPGRKRLEVWVSRELAQRFRKAVPAKQRSAVMRRGLEAELEGGTEAIRAALREMFADGQLDPYHTSDSAPEYVLRKWCGYKENDT